MVTTKFVEWVKLHEARGLYGQQEGPTQQANSMYDRIDVDNRVAEGEEVARLNSLIRQRKFKEAGAYIESLRKEGNDLTRLYSMITRAMYKAI